MGGSGFKTAGQEHTTRGGVEQLNSYVPATWGVQLGATALIRSGLCLYELNKYYQKE